MTNSNETNSLNFSGLTHDHTIELPPQEEASGQHDPNQQNHHHHECHLEHQQDSSQQQHASTIVILRRHPMYDCLVLVKRFRECLGGHALEFPLTKVKPTTNQQACDDSENKALDQKVDGSQQPASACSRRRLISRFLDGDDPIYHPATGCLPKTQDSDEQEPSSPSHFKSNLDEELAEGLAGEVVHVPVNGLLDRLKNYTESGLAVDSRVYAFAMGLKTAERMLTTSSLKELQETPLI